MEFFSYLCKEFRKKREKEFSSYAENRRGFSQVDSQESLSVNYNLNE